MASSFESKLAPEIRLEIYSHALCFNRPLKKTTTSCTTTAGISSLLAVSKNIYNEAIDVFYEVNTFTFHLGTVCPLRKGIAARKRLFTHKYRSLRFVTDDSMIACGAECLLALLAEMRGADNLRRVTAVEVVLQQGTLQLQSLLTGLKSTGHALEFTAVGHFTATPMAGIHGPRLRFEYPAISTTWFCLAEFISFQHRFVTAVQEPELGTVKKRLLREARQSLKEWQGSQIRRLGAEPGGVGIEDLRPWVTVAHTAEENMRATKALAPFV
ncbi:hypothetical protein LTR36_008522 [Oleoguttula mirabilis]|uniref:Uncharacterized protein n=1 Tax=Oleoguttula mirabilis TaxID=1507867 RepID=A0AAV9JT93_9PEZI|nr:hypothetical protein LTR36_008522 [Oleoguttula mirabilis]